MNLSNFNAVYQAAKQMSMIGESLVFLGDGKRIAVNLCVFSTKKMLRITELHIDASSRQSRDVDFFSFRNEEFEGLILAPEFAKLLEPGGT